MKNTLRLLALILGLVLVSAFFGCKQAGQLRFGDEGAPSAEQIENALIPFAKPNVEIAQGEQAAPEQGVDVGRTPEVPLPQATPPPECDFGQVPPPNVRAYLNAKAFFASQPYQALMSTDEFAKKVAGIEEKWKTNLETISDMMFFCLMDEEKKCKEKLFVFKGTDYKPFFDNLPNAGNTTIGDIVIYTTPEFYAFQKDGLLFIGTSAYINVAAALGTSILNCYQPPADSIISVLADMPKPFVDKIQKTGIIKVETQNVPPDYKGGIIIDVKDKNLEIVLKFFKGTVPFIGFDTKIDLAMIDWNNLVKKVFESSTEEPVSLEEAAVAPADTLSPADKTISAPANAPPANTNNE